MFPYNVVTNFYFTITEFILFPVSSPVDSFSVTPFNFQEKSR